MMPMHIEKHDKQASCTKCLTNHRKDKKLAVNVASYELIHGSHIWPICVKHAAECAHKHNLYHNVFNPDGRK